MNPSPQAVRGAIDLPLPGAAIHGRDASMLMRAAPCSDRAGRCRHQPFRRSVLAEGGRDVAGRRLSSHRVAMPTAAMGDKADEAYAGVAAVAGEEADKEVSDAMEVGTINFTPKESDTENGVSSTNREGESQIETEGDTPSVSSEPEGFDKSEAPYKIGDVVVGKTLWCNERGAKIELLDYKGHQGFVSRRQFPYRLLETQNDSFYQSGNVMLDCVREYQIMGIPDRIIPYKVGPLLSARELDKNLMMDRMVQLHDVSRQDREVWKTTVLSANKGGLKVLMAGRACFLPKSHILDDEIKELSEEDFLAKYKGQNLEVAIMQVEPIEDRVLVSMKRAAEYTIVKNIRPGSLVWGNVRKVLDWGAFISMDGTRESALIHRSNISKGRFSTVEDIFQVGDRVCAVVLGMEEDFTRISCSTADLEEQPGDMVKDRQYVYEHAEEQMERIRGILAEREDGIYDDDGDFEEFAN